MEPMSMTLGKTPVRWYRSFYFRIGFSFVVFVVAVLVAQSVMFSGIVVLPPGPPPNPVAREMSRLLSVPGTALLIVATVIAAAFIFAPARRRLTALQQATQRLGAGDLTARAPDDGGDEVAEVAATF